MNTIRISRRVICTLLCVFLLLATMSATAMAAPGGNGRGNAYGSGANQEYQQATAYFTQWGREAAALGIDVKANELNKLAKAYGQRQGGDKEAFILYLTDWTNDKIERQVVKAQKTRRDDTALLLAQVDFLVDNVLYWGDRTGYEIECIYVAYRVDGQVLMIDPLRVVNTRR